MAIIPAPVDEATTWKRCSTCRGAIAFGALYYVCSVSTCNRVRLTYRFCSVECWEEHLPLMRHREAWAVEETAPTKNAWAAQEGGGASPVRPTAEVSKREESTARPTAPAAAAAPAAPAAAAVPAAKPVVAAPSVAAVTPDAPRRRIRVGSAPRPAALAPAAPAAAAAASADDVLVVVSRFKAYVRERFGMNTSDSVMEALSDHLRAICHRAAENARSDGRKTVMDRDFEFLKRRG
jgi:hypothetical protein